MRMTSSNPVFRSAKSYDYVSENSVTYAGVAIRTLFLIMVTVGTAFLTLINLNSFNMAMFFGAMIVAFVCVIVGTRSIRLSPIFAILYAACEGVVLGILSLLFETIYPGIVQVALTTTMIVLLVMLLLFSTGIIKITRGFATVLVVALISVIFVSVISLFVNFGTQFVVVISIVSSLLSALFLLLDFQSIKTCVESGYDRKIGWVLSLGLMVTIVWIYVEMLRLFAIFSRR